MARLGIYDSGIGGISVLQEIRRVLPDAGVTYLADHTIMPLGEKSRDFIYDRVKQAVEYLFNHDCSLVILACNTASVVCICHLQQNWIQEEYAGTHNLLGINVPLLEAMDDQFGSLKSKAGVVISTSATYDSGFYHTRLAAQGFTHLQPVASADLASAIEDNDPGRIDTDLTEIVSKLKTPADDIDYVVLACTHYRFAQEQIDEFFAPATTVVEPAPYVAEKLKDYLVRHPEYPVLPGNTRYLTTGDDADFVQKITRLTGEMVSAERVSF